MAHCEVLIESAPRSGEQNMAIDAQLLADAVEKGESTLRFYRWDQPTISLGYFQKSDTPIPDDLAGLPVVKRLSGGGAILHDQELTYSIALAKSHPWTRDPSRLYVLVHDHIIAILEAKGLTCRLRGDQEADPSNKSFLCFSRADANDIVADPGKIVGSAQRRRRGSVLQHGSLILSSSEYTPEFSGVLDLGVSTTFEELSGQLSKRLISAMHI